MAMQNGPCIDSLFMAIFHSYQLGNNPSPPILPQTHADNSRPWEICPRADAIGCDDEVILLDLRFAFSVFVWDKWEYHALRLVNIWLIYGWSMVNIWLIIIGNIGWFFKNPICWLDMVWMNTHGIQPTKYMGHIEQGDILGVDSWAS